MVRESMKSEYDLQIPHQGHGAPSSRVSMNKSSHVITKIKPKIRIIHIFAPEIIKTDVHNFRALVQSLTGKQAAEAAKAGRRRAKPKNPVITNQAPNGADHHQVNMVARFSGLLANGTVKEDWSLGECSNSNTYFDLEGLIDLEDDFSPFPMKTSPMDHDFMFNSTSDQTKGYLP
ncbi:PREDICTED: VQ motif-containing protein 18-like [Tarenaya hassleriana]|uniref:VQ motif-containing protein 18-like n=1 Tax=Tarenaya hassleriana TaxID=28532 RepID=UPI00053C8EEA|nr:PREDICTED: VQ motif-containing protein 18-like [Tarenaya hassleriana]